MTRAAGHHRRDGPDLAEQLIVAATKRSNADCLCALESQEGHLRATDPLLVARG